MPDIPAQTLRDLLKPGAGVVIPGAANALAARIIESAGFPVVYMTGAGIANSYLGAPDMGLTSVTEMAAHLAAFREAVDIPIVADGDTGFGNALNLVRTIRLYERAGANAIQLEDQTFPKRCGHFDNKSVVGKAEMVQKIKAAVDTRRDADMVIIARTDARAVEGMPAALDRMNAYLEAGADVGFVEAPQNVEELAAIPKAIGKPALANIFEGGKTPPLPKKQLEAMGYRLGIYPSQTHRAAIAAAKKVLGVLKRDGDTAAIESELATFMDREDAVNSAHWRAIEQKYLKDA